jgi:hypothetical protein
MSSSKSGSKSSKRKASASTERQEKKSRVVLVPDLFSLGPLCALPFLSARSHATDDCVGQKKGERSPAPKKAKALDKVNAAEKVKSKGAKKKKVSVRYDVRDVVPERFDLDDAVSCAAGLAHLRSEGYVVWRDVVPADDMSQHIARFWDYVEAACPRLDRTKPSTWTNARWPGLLSVFIFRYHGIGQSPFLWKVMSFAHTFFLFFFGAPLS